MFIETQQTEVFHKMADKKITVLLVDDEPVQVESICRGLFMYQYEWQTASNAKDAMEILQGPQGVNIDLLLTDLTMPGRSGLELIQQARTLFPSLKVMIISGLGLTPAILQVAEQGIPILEKPFSPDKLDQRIRNLVFSSEAITGKEQ